MYVGEDTTGRSKNNVIEVYMAEDDAPLISYTLNQEEIYAVVQCPVTELIKVHQDGTYSFTVTGIKYDKSEFQKQVTKDTFPWNWDNYHFKMALLAERYFMGEKPLLY